MAHEIVGLIVTALVLTAVVSALSQNANTAQVLSTSFAGARSLQAGISAPVIGG